MSVPMSVPMSVTMPPASGITLMTPMAGTQLIRPAMTFGPHTAIMAPTANMGMLRPSPVGFPGEILFHFIYLLPTSLVEI